MLEAIQDRANYQIAKNMLDTAHARQKAIASNIANFENPGYKRIDVAESFQSEPMKPARRKRTTSLAF